MAQPEDGKMELFDHLNELRARLLKSVLAIIVTTAASATLAQRIIELLARPIGGIQNLQAIEVTENISVFMRVSLLGGVTLAMPVIVYQLLAFIMPGLKTGEKKWVYIAVPMASLLFLAGVLFAYFVMLPSAVTFLISFLGVAANIRLSNYMGFVTNLMFWIGLSFETPLLVFFLAKLKIVTAKTLLRQWRVAIVVIAVIAAVATPTVDPVNMGLLMAPLFVLYLLSVLMAFLAR
ncbi:MAG: twin-arginine translocase subunit TatC [Chloroflexi bacterium]|nr:twin-arginine translocase subunit TatC [Chloroflexota bacterium]